MTLTLESPSIAPGIYPDMSAAVYHALPLASNSRLSMMARSPLHCRHAMDNPTPPTPALLLGTAAHCSILEPERFADHYKFIGTCTAVKAKGDYCTNPGVMLSGGRAFCGVHCKGMIRDLGEVIAAADHQACVLMRDAIMSHPAARRLIEAAEQREVSAVFEDPDVGLLCKMRADGLAPSLGCIVDIKTTEDASAEAFTKSIFNFGYFRQAAMYLRGLAALGQRFDHFAIIAVEKSAPFGVGVYRLTDDAIYAGVDALLPLMERYKACESSGAWPGYGEKIQDIGLPRWARPREE